MSKVIAIVNFKGGVGKTTSVLNIGAGISDYKSVLLIDLDPQHNLTQSVNIETETEEPTIYESLVHGAPVQVVGISDTLHIVASDIKLIRAEMELSGVYRREVQLRRILEPLSSDYDYVLIDCPPSLGLLTQNAIEAADTIFTPVAADYLALKGYRVLSDALSRVERKIDRAFITRYDQRKVLARNVQTALREELGPRLFETVIRENVALAEAPAAGLSIFEYNPTSAGADDYTALVNEILNDE